MPWVESQCEEASNKVRQEILVLGSQAIHRKHQEDLHSRRDIDFSSQMGMEAENTKALVSATVVNRRKVSEGRPSGEFEIFASLADLHHRLGVGRLPHRDKNTKQDLPLDTCCAQSFWDVAGLGDPVPFSVWAVLRLVRAKPSRQEVLNCIGGVIGCDYMSDGSLAKKDGKPRMFAITHEE
jgi:hypothetical protein